MKRRPLYPHSERAASTDAAFEYSSGWADLASKTRHPASSFQPASACCRGLPGPFSSHPLGAGSGSNPPCPRVFSLLSQFRANKKQNSGWADAAKRRPLYPYDEKTASSDAVFEYISGWADLNRRHLGPEPSALAPALQPVLSWIFLLGYIWKKARPKLDGLYGSDGA